MRYQDRIYIQTSNTCLRNNSNLNVNMSSDVCVFSEPTFTMSGASKILTGTTISDSLVHIVDSGTTIDFTFSFTGNVDTFTTVDTTFKYKIHEFNKITQVFKNNPIYESSDVEYSTFSGTSAFTHTITTDSFNLDNEYLIKGSYDFTVCTEILEMLGETINTGSVVVGSEYGIYDSEFDNYFAVIANADKPEFALTSTSDPKLGALTVLSYTLSGETEIELESPWIGDIIVALNGVTLANGDDYTTLENVITLLFPSFDDDILTVAFVNSGNPNGLVSESIIIIDAITSGSSGNEGSNLVYFNSGTSEYEVYTTVEPLEFNDVILTLNGVTLANGLDYYQSSTNPKRITLAGVIYSDADLGAGLGDIITLTYNAFSTYSGVINVDVFDVYWTIPNPPVDTNGEFTLTFADDATFSATAFTTTIQYVANEVSYNATIDLSSYSGITGSYKVINQKNYTLITGDEIPTTTDSEIISVEINL